MPENDLPHHISRQIFQVACYLVSVIENQEKIMATQAEILDGINSEADLVKKVIFLMDSLHEDLQAAKNTNDPALMQQVLDHFASNKAEFAAALARDDNSLSANPAPNPPPAP